MIPSKRERRAARAAGVNRRARGEPSFTIKEYGSTFRMDSKGKCTVTPPGGPTREGPEPFGEYGVVAYDGSFIPEREVVIMSHEEYMRRVVGPV